MAATSRKGAAAASAAPAPRRIIEMMKEATGASDEDIVTMLQLCGGDANEATTKLLESEPCFRAVVSKGKGLEEERQKGGKRNRAVTVSSQPALCVCSSSNSNQHTHTRIRRPGAAAAGSSLPGHHRLNGTHRGDKCPARQAGSWNDELEAAASHNTHHLSQPTPATLSPVSLFPHADPFERVKSKQEKRREVILVIMLSLRPDAGWHGGARRRGEERGERRATAGFVAGACLHTDLPSGPWPPVTAVPL